jgi:hypothetical protein
MAVFTKEMPCTIFINLNCSEVGDFCICLILWGCRPRFKLGGEGCGRDRRFRMLKYYSQCGICVWSNMETGFSPRTSILPCELLFYHSLYSYPCTYH